MSQVQLNDTFCHEVSTVARSAIDSILAKSAGPWNLERQLSKDIFDYNFPFLLIKNKYRVLAVKYSHLFHSMLRQNVREEGFGASKNIEKRIVNVRKQFHELFSANE